MTVELGPLPNEFWDYVNAWAAAHPSPMGRQDIGWALERCVIQYAASAIAKERESHERALAAALADATMVERERCAKLCEDYASAPARNTCDDAKRQAFGAEECADIIRAAAALAEKFPTA